MTSSFSNTLVVHVRGTSNSMFARAASDECTRDVFGLATTMSGWRPVGSLRVGSGGPLETWQRFLIVRAKGGLSQVGEQRATFDGKHAQLETILGSVGRR